MNNAPAYLPGGVSAIAGGLCPMINIYLPAIDWVVFCSDAKKNLGTQTDFLKIINLLYKLYTYSVHEYRLFELINWHIIHDLYA